MIIDQLAEETRLGFAEVDRRFDVIAAAAQQEFLAVCEEMAEMKGELKADIRRLEERIDRLELNMERGFRAILDRLNEVDMRREAADLQVRMDRAERKLGMGHG